MKRATVVKTLVTHLVDNFNPRPREEGDTHRKVSAAIATHFNPRPREEGDKGYVPNRPVHRYFNPRPREEGDDLNSENHRH